MPSAIGRLRHRLTIETVIRTPDGGGGAAKTWTTFVEVWGRIRPTGGAEIFDADAVAGRVSHEIILRHRPGITAAMRLCSGARRFDIITVIDVDERHRWLKCLCVERAL